MSGPNSRLPIAMSPPLLLLLLSAGAARAHDHHGDNIPEGEFISPDPLDGILWWHIFSMVAAFGLLFPAGMVLGIVKNRWHVPVQVVGTVIAVMGWFLGHAHKGRQFAPNIHGRFANVLMLALVVQVAVGIYLKLHLERGFHGRIRRFIVPIHSITGKLIPLLAWVQMLFGGITALGFCHDDHLGQCLAHFIMGSSFIIYGIFMTAMLFVGQAWLERSGRSQEFWDSLVISVWGCINTFTEHRWGQKWEHNDFQHTSMGIVWWCAGLLGIWLSRGKNGEPRRNVIPGVVIFLTGYAMSAHEQHLMLSTMVHTVFGYTLMAAGISRIIEICFLLRDAPAQGEPSSWQHLPPYLLFASGFLFMGATEEQLAMIASAEIDHVSYTLVLYSLAFLMYLFVQILIHVFIKNKKEPKTPYMPVRTTNGMRHSREQDEQRAREVDEFELEGLVTDDDSDGENKERK